MAKQFMVSTIFKGIDRMSKTFKAIGSNGVKAFNKIGKIVSSTGQKINNFGKNSNLVKGAVFGGAIVGAVSLTGAINNAISTGVQFEQTMQNATAKFGVERGTKQFQELEKSAREVGRTTQFSATEAGEGLNFLAMAGFNAQQSIKALPGLSKLAIATNMDLAEATDIVSDSLGAFGKMSKNPDILAKNLEHMNDVMSKTTLTSNVDLTTMFETIKFAGPVATSAGESMEELSAMIGIMANSGIKGTNAGTALRTMFINLQKPTAAMKTALKKANVSIADSQGKMRSMSDIMGQLHKGMANYTDVQRNAALATIFGKNALSGATLVYNAGEKKIKEYTKALDNSDGSTAKLAKTMQDTTEGRIKAMNSAMGDLSITFFKTQKGGLNLLITGFTNMVNTINGAINKYPILGEIIQDVAIAIGVIAGAIGVASAATMVWNAILAINPFIAIAMGVTLLIVGIVALIEHFGGFKKVLQDVWNFVLKLQDVFINFGKSILLSILSPIQKVLTLVTKIPVVGSKFAGLSASVDKFAQGLEKTKNMNVGMNNKQQNAGIQIITPMKQQANIINTNNNNTTNSMDINIKDKNNRADVNDDVKKGSNINLKRSM